MEQERTHNYIASWSDTLLSQGRFSFSLSEFKEKNSKLSDAAIKFALKRMTDKGKLLPVFKGYYLLIPPQFASKGVLSPTLFLDAFMGYLDRPYYLALLNAASFYGSSHQQPQEYFVMTGFPVLRPTLKKGLKINYISISKFPFELIVKRKTEAGYINVSKPVLTACDLVQFEKRVGGLNRAGTVLNELVEEIKPADFSPVLLKHVHVTVLQRLGFMLEKTCGNIVLADSLYESIIRERLNFYRIPLKATNDKKGFFSDNRWKVIVNTEIEIDE